MEAIGIKGRRTLLFGDGDFSTAQDFLFVLVDKMCKGILHSCVNKLYCREFIVDEMDKEFRWGEDFSFNVHYFSRVERVSLIGKALYHYDCTSESVTRGKYQTRKPYIDKLHRTCLDIMREKYSSEMLEREMNAKYISDVLEDYKLSTAFFKMKRKTIIEYYKAYEENVGNCSLDSWKVRLFYEKRFSRLLAKMRTEKVLSGCKFFIKRILKRRLRGAQ